MIMSRASKGMKMENSTSYGSEFSEKDFSKPQPIYSATNSGFRRNNPHPSREFLEWKIPRGGAREEQIVLDEDKLKEVFKKQLASSYQQDYLGTQPEEAGDIEERMAALRTDSKKNYYKDTSMRHSYNEPKVDENLQGNTTRYGCNGKKHKSAIGIVPTVQHSPQSLTVSSNTSYTTQFGTA
ncbi:testis-expressed protein 26-like isoform X2 [Bolinopsis microptera]|uniref:testis-expressed protein 26-like isoform X2 n=1 Tax=Bolinopsis microptera TaxID=2820187 RepID=UPI00307AD749